jgi:hypothetical protein
MGMRLVVASSHELLMRVHAAHGEARAGDVGVRHRHAVSTGKVVGSGPGGVLLKRVQLVVFALELVLVVVAQWLAVRAGLVCATMSAGRVSICLT